MLTLPPEWKETGQLHVRCTNAKSIDLENLFHKVLPKMSYNHILKHYANRSLLQTHCPEILMIWSLGTELSPSISNLDDWRSEILGVKTTMKGRKENK